MAGTITRTPCPECGMVGYLEITTRFIARPIGDFSLAGNQMKLSGAMKPVLKCNNCTFDLVGEFEGDNHATFGPTAKMLNEKEARARANGAQDQAG